MKTEEINGKELVTQTVSLPITVEQAVKDWEDYQKLTKELLEPSDYQKIGQKTFKKKSAWRKYGKAFNLSTAVSYEEIDRDKDGFPVYARIRVKATAQNGRTEEADHECHVSERCCPVAIGEQCFKKKDHYHCPKECNGRRHWAHPGDIPATALTRAKNRAIADLIGAGEVSAEETEADSEYRKPEEKEKDDRRPKDPPNVDIVTGQAVAEDVPAVLVTCPIHKKIWKSGKFGLFHKSEIGPACNEADLGAWLWKNHFMPAAKRAGMKDIIDIQKWYQSAELPGWKEMTPLQWVMASDRMSELAAREVSREPGEDDVPY